MERLPPEILRRQDELYQPTVEGFGKAILLRSVASREASEHPRLMKEVCRAVSSVPIVAIQSREFDVHAMLSAKASPFGRDGRVKDLSSVKNDPQKRKTTAPRIPAWSPTVVLTRRHSG